MKISLTINGVEKRLEVSPSDSLLNVLRGEGYKGAKFGCGEGACGACTVILDRRPVNSCLVLAATIPGSSVVTIEGLGTPDAPHPLQTAFLDVGAVQCGYCTPGMILAAKSLLDRNPHPEEEEIKAALDGNLCRCTGYKKQIEAVRLAGRRMAGSG